ncbi:polysaccharide deacetylase family protein [Cytobacillus gottheilii]|uniref:polysaccharide deacetylase family protein n=1 Tax=Cytobacillus gottheilii TaxID=859144 RepID=UPI0009BB5C3D|nr:polysaccharide deacetylase family protein [Cytobacillus gottheilii]
MKKLSVLIIMTLISFLIVNNPMTTTYVASLKTESIAVTGQTKPLLDEIKEKAESYYIAPADAKIDRVWKALPGLNGVKVNIEESYKKMKKDNVFDEDKLVFDQIPPKVHLSDLSPSPVYKGHPDKPMVSFIINVAWGNEYLPDMLATLKKHHVSASFFLEGRWAQNNPDLAKMIAAAGHELGNHSYTHPDMKNVSAAKAREEIKKTNEVIEAITDNDAKVRWFAPPSGSYRDEIVSIAAEEELGTVMWTVDTIDWQKPTPDVLIQRVMGKVHSGAMILMHPTKSTAESLDRLIKGLKSKNLEIGTVSQLLNEDRIFAEDKK